MRRFIEDFKMKNIAFFLLFFLLVSGHSNANAVGGSIGGWKVVSNVASGIGAKITATKDVLVNGAKTTVTGTANIMPNPSNMGKFMLRLGGAAVVTEAINQILNGVDYVMDPANNSIQTQPNAQDTPAAFTRYSALNGATPDSPSGTNKYIYYHTAPISVNDFCKQASTAIKGTYGGSWEGGSVCYVNKDGKTLTLSYSINRTNPKYSPSAVIPDKQTIPLPTIGSQVIEQAEKDIKAGNPASPAVALSRAVAQDMVQEAEADDVKARPIAQQLEKNPEYPSDNDAEGEITKPEVIDPATGEVVKPAETSSIAMQFPKACEWFPQACLFIDWAMTDPNVDSDMEVPEKEIEKQEIKKDLVKISGRSCPSDVKFDVDGLPFGIKINKAYSMQEICNTVEPLKYVFELITAVICALILLRV